MQKLINTLLTLVIGLTPIISYAATDQGIMGAPAVATQKEMAPDETNEPKAKVQSVENENVLSGQSGIFGITEVVVLGPAGRQLKKWIQIDNKTWEYRNNHNKNNESEK